MRRGQGVPGNVAKLATIPNQPTISPPTPPRPPASRKGSPAGQGLGLVAGLPDDPRHCEGTGRARRKHRWQLAVPKNRICGFWGRTSIPPACGKSSTSCPLGRFVLKTLGRPRAFNKLRQNSSRTTCSYTSTLATPILEPSTTPRR